MFLLPHEHYTADIREQLAAMGESVADQQYANILLASLPSCYGMRICAITTNADETGKTIDPARIAKLISDDYSEGLFRIKTKAFNGDCHVDRPPAFGKKYSIRVHGEM